MASSGNWRLATVNPHHPRSRSVRSPQFDLSGSLTGISGGIERNTHIHATRHGENHKPAPQRKCSSRRAVTRRRMRMKNLSNIRELFKLTIISVVLRGPATRLASVCRSVLGSSSGFCPPFSNQQQAIAFTDGAIPREADLRGLVAHMRNYRNLALADYYSACLGLLWPQGACSNR